MVLDIEYEKSYLRKYFTRGYHDVVKAIRYLSKDNNEHIAASFFSKANTSFVIIDSYIHSKGQELIRDEITSSLSAFEILYSEFLTSYATNHSFQYTFIYYEEFKSTLYSCFGLLDINIDLEV